MGQYFLICNLDKREFLHPHVFSNGMKLMEFGCSGMGTMTALAVLLANGNGRGGGDFKGEDILVGSWAGDRIVITGDYADEGLFVDKEEYNLYLYAQENYTDISVQIREVLCQDKFLEENLRESW